MHSFHLFLLLSTIWFFLPICTPTGYAYHYMYNCTTSNSTFAPNSAYDLNLKTLFSWLSSNATISTGSYYTEVSANSPSDTVYGLFQCNGDIFPKTCQKCVNEAVEHMKALCATSKDAIIWVEVCFLRYSYWDFFSTIAESPKLFLLNPQDYAGQVASFNSKLFDMLNDLRTRVANIPTGSRRFAYEAVNITDNQTLYGMAKCTPDLVPDNCSWCIAEAIAAIPNGCCKGKIGGRVLFPSCGVRFELFQFYQSSATLALLPDYHGPYALAGKRKNRSLIIVSVIVPTALSMLLLYFGRTCFLRRRQRMTDEAILKESFGNEVTTLESLRFDLNKIEAATNKFATANKIGKGGFGEVYKGILLDGQEIAVKRLLGNSWQGAEEFKNEVLVIAKLQHKNLVRLLGFCLEGQEKILVYEYVSNKSLDYFLFDPEKRSQLTWFERYKIIRGISRGILYLHEDSRLTIIHRDLKPSNVLLDGHMNPKISDFGMARIMVADQIQENTSRIVGTYGYMSPEYAMQGQFSIKSDVFSFGIMILEIISGKRKDFSYEPHVSDDIRSYAWTKWKEQTPLELLDTNWKGSYSENEVMRCIQIGLLCVQEDPDDRPTMAAIVSYLNSSSVDLPLPHEPVFFKNSRKMDDMPYKELDSFNDSINEVTMSTFSPR